MLNSILSSFLKSSSIGDKIDEFINELLAVKSDIKLNEGEVMVSYVIYEENGKALGIPAVFDDNNKIVRFIGKPIEIKQQILDSIDKAL